MGTFAPDGQPIGPGKYNFLSATGDVITQEGEYKSDEPADPDAAPSPPTPTYAVHSYITPRHRIPPWVAGPASSRTPPARPPHL